MDDKTLMRLSRGMNRVTYGQNKIADNLLRLVRTIPKIELKVDKETIVSPSLFGDHNFENISTALCIGKYFVCL